jgi:hypothetical protein
MACGIYISITVQLLAALKPKAAYLQGLDKIQSLYYSSEYALEKPHFDRVFSDEIARISIEEINSGAYLIDTLEASLWCLLNSSSYAQAVLTSVNLGGILILLRGNWWFSGNSLRCGKYSYLMAGANCPQIGHYRLSKSSG